MGLSSPDFVVKDFS